MDEESSVKLLKNMLEIYSPSGKETKLASFIKNELERLSFGKVRIDKVGNVYGSIGTGDPCILLCGHMDTVPGEIPAKIEGNRLRGRGAADAKASLAAMMCAAANLNSRIKEGSVIIAGVVEEESSGKGILQLLHEDLNVKCAVFGEPSGVNNITFAYKGHFRLRLICRTDTGHVGAQHLLSNAIEESFDLWNYLKSSCGKYSSPQGIFYSLTPSLIGISSERTSGGVPDIATLDVDVRLPPTIRFDEAVEIVKKTIETFQSRNADVSVDLKILDKVEPFVAKRNTFLMKALAEAISEVTGEAAKFLRKTGTGDMNIFGSETGIPVATYGPGNARLSHTHNESIDVSEYLLSIRVYKQLIEKILLMN